MSFVLMERTNENSTLRSSVSVPYFYDGFIKLNFVSRWSKVSCVLQLLIHVDMQTPQLTSSVVMRTPPLKSFHSKENVTEEKENKKKDEGEVASLQPSQSQPACCSSSGKDNRSKIRSKI